MAYAFQALAVLLLAVQYGEFGSTHTQVKSYPGQLIPKSTQILFTEISTKVTGKNHILYFQIMLVFSIFTWKIIHQINSYMYTHVCKAYWYISTVECHLNFSVQIYPYKCNNVTQHTFIKLFFHWNFFFASPHLTSFSFLFNSMFVFIAGLSTL